MNYDQTIEYYQRRAGEYEKIYHRDNPARQAELSRLYALSRRVLADRTVLDLACGTGFWTRIVSESATAIIGVDINSQTLTEARKKQYFCPTEFLLSDMHNLPLAPNRSNALLATYVVSHVRRQDIDCLRKGIRRIIGVDSPAFICDNNLVCELKPDLIWDDEHVNTYKRRWLENGQEYLILKNYFDRDELKSLFDAWGKISEFVFEQYYWAITLTMK